MCWSRNAVQESPRRIDMSVRILMVEDFEPFRRLIRSTLGKTRDLQVICEVADGLEAVQKAEELHPDLILLDVGLPRLNGIEAARRICRVAPKSKILFLSQESSADVVQEALSFGAGYVIKARAESELAAAVEAVIQGRRFVSSGLSGHTLTRATDAQGPALCHKKALPSLVSRRAEITRSHEAQFYSDDAAFLVGFTCFIDAALKAGNAVIVVATEPHQKGLLQRLQAQGLNIGAAIEQGRYLPLDVAETLSTFMVNDLPDPVRFLRVAGDLVAAAAKTATGEHPRVAACGECAPILWAQGNADAAIQLEHLWDEIASTCNVDILCGYVLKSFQREEGSYIYASICAEHSAVY
jgi:DNA-binding NarL/FixJ family response regulator